MGIHRRHSITRRSRGDRRCGTAFGQLGVGLLFAIAIVSSGCRSGTSTFSSPSWWAFGNSAGSDPEKLAAAPPFDGKTADGKITKPSQTATPYPTTTTPNSYSVADATRGLPNDPAATDNDVAIIKNGGLAGGDGTLGRSKLNPCFAAGERVNERIGSGMGVGVGNGRNFVGKSVMGAKIFAAKIAVFMDDAMAMS
jgi:hypothetical protein